MRSKRLKLNTISSLLLQITTIICGFILPRLILNRYGSEVNGLVNSITQFLAIISFFELGMGAVVQSALYKPLADNDNNEISKIVSSAEKFFRMLAKILLVYVIILVVAYPLLTKSSFDFKYTAFLILAMSISSFAQYYFGITNNIILSADQKGYIHFFSQTISIIANTFLCAILIRLGFGIQIVKLGTSLIYLVRPLFLSWYVRKNYSINHKIKYDKEPISQKWNGIAQHLAGYVLDSTDIIVLTLLSTLENVSIYSVYHLVVFGVKQLLIATTNGIQSVVGELWAKKELKELNRFFGVVEWTIHSFSIFAFGCTSVLIVPFVMVYTKEVNDANYYVPIFAFLITLAHLAHCLKTPYQIVIIACNHFKQTQKCFIIAAIINIVVSIITVRLWGIIGVAIGTLVAMAYQTVWMIIYNIKGLFHWPWRNTMKQIITDLIVFCIGMGISRVFVLSELTFFSWFLLAIKVAIVWAFVFLFVNFFLYRENITTIWKKLLHRS